jgi:hypothetical protein
MHPLENEEFLWAKRVSKTAADYGYGSIVLDLNPSRSRSRSRWKSGKKKGNRIGSGLGEGAGFRKRGFGNQDNAERPRKKRD